MSTVSEILNNQNTVINAQRIVSLQEELFIMGYSFTARDVVTAPAATNLYIRFDATAATGIQVIFSPLKFVAGEAGPIVITYYVNPTVTAGGRTEIMGSNRRATSTNEYQSVIELVAAANVTSPGTKFTAELVPSNSAGGALPSSGASNAGGLPFEIDTDVVYMIEIDNTNGTDTLFEYNIDWFEAPV